MKASLIISLFASLALSKHTMKIGGVDIVAHDPDMIIKDEYLIVFKKDTHSSIIDDFHTTTNSMQNKLQARSRIRTGSLGFKKHFAIGNSRISHGSYSPEMLATMLNHPSVDFIEANSLIKAASTSKGQHYNLERVSRPQLSHARDVNNYDDNTFTYAYPSLAGSGVNVYVMDSGVDTTHPEFENRASWGWACDQSFSPATGHGTFVAGLIAAKSLGVAPKAKIISVKVLTSDTGAIDGVFEGIKWTITDAKKRSGTAIVNLSLDSGYYPALNQAVEGMVQQGLVVVVAAGNSNVDAKDFSPASAKGVISVGATDYTDSRWMDNSSDGSNYGSTVSLFAPGVDVYSIWPGNGYTTSFGGTSFAAPHVAGIAALVIAQAGGAAAPADVKNTILTKATTVTIKNAGNGSPMKMAYNGGEAGLALIKASTTTPPATTTAKPTTMATSTKAATSTSTSKPTPANKSTANKSS